VSKYLLRLLSYSLLLGVLPAVIIGIASYTIASENVERKVKEVNMQWLTQTQMRIEQMLRSVEKSATQFANSSLVKASMEMAYDITDFEAIRELTEGLYNLQSSDVVITQAYLVNLERGWALSLNTLKPLPEMENVREFMDYAASPKSILWHAGTPAANGEEREGEGTAGTVTLVHKIPILPQTDRPQGLLVIRVMASDINEALNSPASTNYSYVLDRAGAGILGVGQPQTGYETVNRAVLERLGANPEQPAGLFHTRMEGKEVAALYRTSAYNGWTYVSLLSIEALRAESRAIAEMTLAMCAAILLAVAAAALYGSRRMYRPIGKLLEMVTGIKRSAQEELPRPGRDELEFIKTSIQSLVVSRDRVEQQMLGQASHLKEFFVLKLLTGQITENDYILRSAMDGFPEKWSHLGVLALQVDNLQDTRYNEEDRELLLYAVGNIAQEVLPASNRFPPITVQYSQVTIVAVQADTPEQAKAAFYTFAEAIKHHAGQVLQLKASIGISSPFTNIRETVKAYGESLTALKARIRLGAEMIVHYGDIEPLPPADCYEYSHLRVLEERLVYAIREMQAASASEILRQYLSAMLFKEGAFHAHQPLLLQLASRVLQIAQDHGIPLSEVPGEEGKVEKLFHLQTREEIIHWFESRLIAPLIRILSEKTDTQYVKIADKLVKIIQERYQEDISLESCAQLLSYHPVYVSRIFKREIGVTFSEYLSDYRMKMAKMLLETTDLKVSEIGERLQYKNISSFIRSYKKLYEITPGQYRDKMMRGSAE
jgi:two-component system, response regulator YesN